LTGPVPVSLGGTGAITLTSNGVLLGNGTSAVTATTAGTTGQVLTGVTGNPPIFQALPSNAVYAYTAVTNATGSPYVVLSTDVYISCDSTAGVITINLPNTTTTGRMVIVKDRTAQASTNNITVTTVGGAVTIDGSTTFVMNTNYESAQFMWNGTSYEVF
jgi:hypothetical protein